MEKDYSVILTGLLSVKIQNSKSCKQLFDICDELLGRKKEPCLPNIFLDYDLPDKFFSYYYFDGKIRTIRENFNAVDVPSENESYYGSCLFSFKPVSEFDHEGPS